MASTKISALPGASTLDGTETIPLVQGGTTKKVTSDQFLTKDASGNVGVGTASPTQRIDAVTAGGTCYARTSNGTITSFSGVAASVGGAVYGTGTNHPVVFLSNGSERVRIDSSGNLGLGVTPYAWSGPKAIDISTTAGFSSTGSTADVSNNAYNNGSWVYKTTAAAALYRQQGGSSIWFTAPSGTAGNPISFTQAMTLDASGDLTTANDRINLITVGRGGGGVATNTASGLNALQSNTTGYYNTASGLNALQSNTTGYYNTASGLNALQSNTTGNYNTASGLNALYSNTTGDHNTASGVSALYTNTTGGYNTASGASALRSNTTGVNNTASGVYALYYNTTGVNNTASGYAALQSNTTGYSNTASGVNALNYNTTGYNNTASGRSSGFNPDNDIAQYRITSDFDMTLVGYGATKDNAGQLWNSTAIGARAKVTKSNQVVLGDSNVTETLVNGNLLVGTTSSVEKLTVNGAIAVTGGISGHGANRATFSQEGANGAFIQSYGGDTSTCGEFVFRQASSDFSVNRIAVKVDTSGNLLVGTTSPLLSTSTFYKENGAGSPALYVHKNSAAASTDQAFCVANGAAGSTVSFQVLASGNVQNTNNSYGAISDLKLKENITDASPKLAKLMQVRIVNYTLKSDPDKTKLIGVVAQELEKVSPGLIEETADRDADGNDLGTTTKSVKYSVFVPMLIKSLQEQQAQIEALEARLAAAGI